MFLRILFIIILSCSIAHAVDRTIYIEWVYTPPTNPQTLGFVLYQESTPVCTFTGPSLRSGECTVALNKVYTSFTLTAKLSDNTESSHSAPYPLSENALLPAPIINSITAN